MRRSESQWEGDMATDRDTETGSAKEPKQPAHTENGKGKNLSPKAPALKQLFTHH